MVCLRVICILNSVHYRVGRQMPGWQFTVPVEPFHKMLNFC